MPPDFVFNELMIEWSLTPQEFSDVPYVTLMRIIEMRMARQNGEQRSQSKNK